MPQLQMGAVVRAKLKGEGALSCIEVEGVDALEEDEVSEVKVEREGKGILKAGEEDSAGFAWTEI